MRFHSLHRTGPVVLIALGLFILSACRAEASVGPAAPPPRVSSIQKAPADRAAGPSQPERAPLETGWALDSPRIDEQGAVSVEIAPLNLNAPGPSLDFSVALNTHSVDLSMDLAALATLITDTGKELAATAWDAPRGGHHVQGVLQFPALQDGAGVLEGVSRLTLVIRGLDAPERIFVWER